jgi:hypothetical protein
MANEIFRAHASIDKLARLAIDIDEFVVMAEPR